MFLALLNVKPERETILSPLRTDFVDRFTFMLSAGLLVFLPSRSHASKDCEYGHCPSGTLEQSSGQIKPDRQSTKRVI
jgi:hypothetical protein